MSGLGGCLKSGSGDAPGQRLGEADEAFGERGRVSCEDACRACWEKEC